MDAISRFRHSSNDGAHARNDVALPGNDGGHAARVARLAARRTGLAHPGSAS